MPYFTRTQNGLERACKIAADAACAVLLLIFSVAFFDWGGLFGFVILEAALISVDYLVPSADDVSGVAVR